MDITKNRRPLWRRKEGVTKKFLTGSHCSNRTLPMVEIGVRHKMIPIVVDAVAEHPPLPSIRKVP